MRYPNIAERIAKALFNNKTHYRALNLLLQIGRDVVVERQNYRMESLTPSENFLKLSRAVDNVFAANEEYRIVDQREMQYLRSTPLMGSRKKMMLDYINELRRVNVGVSIEKDFSLPDKRIMYSSLAGMYRGLIFMNYCREIPGFNDMLDPQFSMELRLKSEDASTVLFYEISIHDVLAGLNRNKQLFDNAFAYVANSFPNIKEYSTYSPSLTWGKYVSEILGGERDSEHYELKKDKLQNIISSSINSNDIRIVRENVESYAEGESVQEILDNKLSSTQELYDFLALAIPVLIKQKAFINEDGLIEIFNKFVADVLDHLLKERIGDPQAGPKIGNYLDLTANLHRKNGAIVQPSVDARIFKGTGVKHRYIYEPDIRRQNMDMYWLMKIAFKEDLG
jgi:hypothetical protein